MMTQKRINLLIIKDCFPMGGTETLILKYLELLDRNTFNVHVVIQTEDKGELIPYARERCDHFICLNRKHLLDIKAIIRLRKYLKKNSIDIVHVNGWLDAIYVRIATKNLVIRRIVTVHGYLRSWRHFVYLEAIKSFDQIICVSKALKFDIFRMGLPYNKLLTLYNCYDDKIFKNKFRTSGYKTIEKLNLVMVGNFGWQKDQITIIKAVNILIKRKFNVKLHIVGGGEANFLNSCKKLVTYLNLNDYVIFTGQKRVDGEFLFNFDLFVFSSLADTFGIAVLEAMACGLPVLVSDIPPLLELIEYGKHGLYFKTGDAYSCAEQIMIVSQDKKLRKIMGEKACLRAKDFSPKKNVRDLEKIYMDTLKGMLN